jgi:hypothetical protein
LKIFFFGYNYSKLKDEHIQKLTKKYEFQKLHNEANRYLVPTLLSSLLGPIVIVGITLLYNFKKDKFDEREKLLNAKADTLAGKKERIDAQIKSQLQMWESQKESDAVAFVDQYLKEHDKDKQFNKDKVWIHEPTDTFKLYRSGFYLFSKDGKKSYDSLLSHSNI